MTRVARAGEKQLRGDDDNDTLTGSGQGTKLLGEDGDDTLWGRGDSGTRRGGGNSTGRTRVHGGDGNDTLIFASIREINTTSSARGDGGFDTARMLDGVDTLVDRNFSAMRTSERLAMRETGAISLTIGTQFSNAFGATAMIEATAPPV